MYYTKYRPQKFSEIFKSNDAVTALPNQVKSKKLVHAYLFVGPRGTGKTTTARILAKAINCDNLTDDGDACDKCASCKAIKVGSFVDLIEIDAASNRSIDDIRDLRERVKLAPISGKYKVYIIDEVHMLTPEAFNALLKTLEEPPKHVTFILCTTEDHKVPETIKSRCQIFKFKRATIDQLVERLSTIAKKEKFEVTKEQLKKIAEASLGSFRDAETLMQQVAEGELDVESFVGTISKQSYIKFMKDIQLCEVAGAVRQINDLYADGIDLYVWCGEFVRYLRDLLFIASDSHEGWVDVSNDLFAKMEDQAGKLEPAEIVRVIEAFVKAQNEIKSSNITQLPLELAVVNVCDHCDGGVTGEREKLDEEKGSSGTSAKKPSPTAVSTTLSFVLEKWSKVLENVVSYNNSLNALLKTGTPVDVEENIIVLDVSYKFHKERLETAKNKKVIEGVLAEIYGVPLTFRCNVRERNVEELTDYNVAVPVISDKDILNFFDGTLPQ